MNRNVVLWILAVAITLASAVYQRATGPTYPMKGKTSLGGMEIKYGLERSHGGDDDHPVSIKIPDHSINGVLSYKRYKIDESWTQIQMNHDGDYLKAYLPHQPPAGKLQYNIYLVQGNNAVRIPEYTDVVIRFKGAVPNMVLIPHIFCMFMAMLVSTRAGMQALISDQKLKTYALWTIAFLFAGGFILGPLMQKYAFGDYWTGFPFGFDLTDNKTLIASIGWFIAAIAVFRDRRPRLFVIGAAVLMMIIFLIPHSALGSELNYSTMQVEQSN